MLFRDRRHAGELLARRLRELAIVPRDAMVLALPRGGVPVGAAIADMAGAPLDVYLVRKLGVPGQEELAMGAIASGGVRVLNDEVVQALRVPAHVIDAAAERELAELERRERVYRGGRPPPELRDRTVVLVDDGLATGSTMRAAAEAVRNSGAAQVIVAVPVSPSSTCEELGEVADRVECLATPTPFFGVGQFYEDFTQTTDAEVLELLDRRRLAAAA